MRFLFLVPNVTACKIMLSTLRTVQCKILVAYSLLQWPIGRLLLIGGKSVGDLETNGVVFVEDDTLVFPLVLLLNLAHAGHAPHVPLLLQKFDVMLSCDESERNSQSIFAMKCVALSENTESITLGKLFPLAQFSTVLKIQR
jgi:hypothetical protein